MPEKSEHELGPLRAAVAVAVFLGLFVGLPALAWWPLGLFFPVLFAVCDVVHAWKSSKMRTMRRGESICEFARSFDCRVVDPWVVRAVYEEFTRHLRFPVRASDRRRAFVDDEDFVDMAAHAAARARRSFEDTERNPVVGKVETFRDLVLFLNHQPPLSKGADA